MQTKFLTVLLILATPLLITASPVPQTYNGVPSVINPSQGPSVSKIITNLNKFINRFSTSPHLLSVDDGTTPAAGAGNVTTIEEGSALKPVVDTTTPIEVDTGNVLQLKPVTPVEAEEAVEVAPEVEDEDEEGATA